jgi:poly-gamma-glutamate capsule biosynthesis protein CapA/YwtB (metallophosphatase superfamily)
MDQNVSHNALRALLGCLSAVLLMPSCSTGGGRLSLEAEPELMPRLEAIASARPLPRGWTLDPVGSSAVLSLELLPLAAPLPRGARLSGQRFLAASVDLASDLFSASAVRAAELGLAPLESIEAPRRALAVDGLWPGNPGYPFTRSLALSIKPSGSARLPRALEAWLADAASAASEAPPIKLAAAGDIQVGERQWPLIARGEDGLRSLLGGILGELREADFAVGNLEAPITARGYPNPRKRFRFRMPPGSGAFLAKAGFGLMLFANNHGLDFGTEGFEDTLADLAVAGLPQAGAGGDREDASAARFVELSPGGRLAFVGYAFYPPERYGFTVSEAAAAPGKAGISADEAAAMSAVRAAAASGAAVVVLAHGGTEYLESPSAAARGLYARFVDAGAALVLGGHTHLLQGCEARTGSVIAYSLGNFLFTGEAEPPAAHKSALLNFLLYRGKVRGISVRPILVGYERSDLDPDLRAAELNFARLCAGLEASD